MTIEEFNQTRFCAGDRFKYHSECVIAYLLIACVILKLKL